MDDAAGAAIRARANSTGRAFTHRGRLRRLALLYESQIHAWPLVCLARVSPGPQLAFSQALGYLRDPKAALASGYVEDASGAGVGRVESVTTKANGRACAVEVKLESQNGKVVSISAGTMLFNPHDDVLRTSLTLAEINTLPSAE